MSLPCDMRLMSRDRIFLSRNKNVGLTKPSGLSGLEWVGVGRSGLSGSEWV